jgi:hypothetical protein
MFRILFFASLIITVMIITAGCGRSPSAVEPPGLPRQSLNIVGDVELSGRVEWDPQTDSLVTIITAKNVGDQPAVIKMGSCSFSLLAYTVPENARKLIWYNRMPDDCICFDEMLTDIINPGELKELEGLANISGTTWAYDLPKGEWQFVVVAKSGEGLPIKVSLNSEVID